MTRVQAVMLAAFGAAALSLAGCAGQNNTAENDNAQGTGENSTMAAVAELSPTQGNDVRGTVTFNQEPSGVRVSANLTGLPPGSHAIFIDQSGTCAAVTSGSNQTGTTSGTSSTSGTSGTTSEPGYGGSNPSTPTTDKTSDKDATMSRNLGTITADQSGRAHVENIVSGVTLEGDNSIVGSAVVIQVSAAGTGTPSGSGTGANQGTANQTGRNGSSTKDKAMAYLACGEITR